MEAVLDAAGVGADVHLVGHSLGGLVVATVAAGRPVASVTVVDQPLRLGGFRDQVGWFEDQPRDPAAFPAVMAAVFEFGLGPRLDPGARERLTTLRRPDQRVVLGVWSFLLEAPPAEIDAAIDGAIIGGRARHLSLFGTDPGPDYAPWLAERVPGAVVEVWDDHGHYPHLVDPDRFTARLQAHWTAVDPHRELPRR